MSGFIVVHAGSGSLGEIYETEEQAQVARLDHIEENLEEAVDHEFEIQEYKIHTREELEERIRKEWSADIFVCEEE